MTAEALLRYDAVRLFVDRAAAASPGFRLTDENAGAVAEVCRRLDGIPLALELAAARLRGLSVAQLAARLDDRFALLTGGSRAALPRQQTLRAAVDWSYDLLSPAEQALFARLSVFAGSFTLEAAEAVADGAPTISSIEVAAEEMARSAAEPAPHRNTDDRSGGSPLQSPDVLDTLLRLVDKSLVIRESRLNRSDAGEGRRRGGQRQFVPRTGDAARVRSRPTRCLRRRGANPPAILPTTSIGPSCGDAVAGSDERGGGCGRGARESARRAAVGARYG